MAARSHRARSSALLPADRAEGIGALETALRGTAGAFTIGRVAVRHVRRLALRYPSAVSVQVIWEGPPGKATAMEKALQLYARDVHADRVANRNIGGGQQAPDPRHVVYVVSWGRCAPGAPAVEERRRGRRRTVVGARPAFCVT